ncbi:hypothetical protein B6U99_04780 [Candidatus Geothermarchaeota archaeon ex4572_27]|nr:MAG: hypothetical protein B6U99_04780 [Candidatus Geothermarchaeota archaeon ex4572_27]
MPEDNEPIAAPKNAPLELKLRIMLRNWSYPEFREVLYREAREGEDHRYANVYKRIYAYLRALELREQGLRFNGVREALRNELGYRLSKSVLSHWFNDVCTPLGSLIVFDVRCPEVGLVMGLILSDGTKGRYRSSPMLRFFNKDEELIEEFKGACRKLGLTVFEKPIPSGCQALHVKSVLLYLLLRRFDEFIIKAPPDVQWRFIRGLWLGDGHISLKVKLDNADLRIINTVSTLLEMHGVGCTIQGPYPPHPPGKKPLYRVYIRGCSKERFLKLAGLAEGPTRPMAP